MTIGRAAALARVLSRQRDNKLDEEDELFHQSSDDETEHDLPTVAGPLLQMTPKGLKVQFP